MNRSDTFLERLELSEAETTGNGRRRLKLRQMDLGALGDRRTSLR